MRAGFRTKIFAALGGVACLAVGLSVGILRQASEQRAHVAFAAQLERTLAGLEQLAERRARTVADEVDVLAATNPQLRTVLSTATLSETDLGFGGEEAPARALEDAHLRLHSLLPSLAVARRSALFAVVTASGDLVYRKGEPFRAGLDLGALPIVRDALSGREAVRLVAPGDASEEAAALLGVEASAPLLVVGRPVLFDGFAHGAVLAGSPLDGPALAEIASIGGAELALVSGPRVLATTLPPARERALATALAASAGLPRERTEEWTLEEEPYLVRSASLLPGAEARGVEFLVLSSRREEIASLRTLERWLLAGGALVAALALAAAFLLARGITRPVDRLAHAARRVGAGELDTEVRIETGDELETLGHAFNEMTRGLREREWLRRRFERFVSREVAAELLKDPSLARMPGARRELTVLFADLGGFTALAEALPAEDVLRHLNEYFAAVCDPILEWAGTVSELQGDGVVAFFGAPIPHPDHAARACFAALGCRDQLRALRGRWTDAGLPALRFRIGVHTDSLIVGEMGSEERAKYGCVGDGMNLASRIEGANRHFGTEVLVSEATLERAGAEVVAREVDRVRVVGRRGPVRLFELLERKGAADPGALRLRLDYEAALGAYREGRWDEARAALETLAARAPEDGPTRTLLSRLRAAPPAPPSGWDGVFELAQK